MAVESISSEKEKTASAPAAPFTITPYSMITDADIQASDMKAYGYIDYRAGKRGWCYCPVSDICETIHLSDKMVRLAIKKLEQKGYITTRRLGRQHAFTLLFTIPSRVQSAPTPTPITPLFGNTLPNTEAADGNQLPNMDTAEDESGNTLPPYSVTDYNHIRYSITETPQTPTIDTTTDTLADANASGGAACADAPVVPVLAAVAVQVTPQPVTPKRSAPKATSPKGRSSAKPAARASPKEKTKATPEQQQYRDACWALLRGPGKLQGINLGIKGDNTEIRAMDWFYLNKVPGQQIKEQFMIMLMDPKYRTRNISMTHLKGEYPRFKDDPAAFRAEYEKHAQRGNSSYGKPAKPDRSPAVAHHESDRDNIF